MLTIHTFTSLSSLIGTEHFFLFADFCSVKHEFSSTTFKKSLFCDSGLIKIVK